MWFRRDLRLHDNAALYHALTHDFPVIPIFIFDKNILDDLEDKHDRRVEFIREAVVDMQEELEKHGSSFKGFYDTPAGAFKELLKNYSLKKVFANEDYEQYAIDRDKEIASLLKEHKTELKLYKDQVVFSKNEILKEDGHPYTVFTPYSKKWLAKLNEFYLEPYPTKKYFKNFYQQPPHRIPSLDSMEFKKVGRPFPSKEIDEDLIRN
ncbi:MAG TPA: deoxyribodipyrimidine photo-lyase, partial [Parafilimonas sp.]|nr:deoxyribodipyrimidine photo-lyase [Parafilimonas sp.]